MDSTDQTAHLNSEISNETASTGDAWIRQSKQLCRALEITNETPSTGDVWIR
jgi:hypothetical protein